MLHFVPINFTNGVLGRPQFGADINRNNYYISGVTDMSQFNLQIGSSPINKNSVYMIKFGMDENGLAVSPVF